MTVDTLDINTRRRQLVLLEEAADGVDVPEKSKRSRDLFLLGALLLVTFGAVLYNFVIATPRYSSEFSYVVRSLDSPKERFSILNVAATGGGADNSEAIVSFIRSRDMLAKLNRDGLVTRMFGATDVDMFSAFPSPVTGHSQEDLYRHFQKYLRPSFDQQSNITHVEIQAFSPTDAQTIALRVMRASEQMVNGLNQRARGSLVDSAAQDVDVATKSLAKTLDQLNGTRNDLRVLEPQLETSASIRNSSSIAGALAQANVELAQTLRVAPGSPVIGQLRARRSAIEAELNRQNSAAAGSPGSLANRIRPYEALKAQREVAEKHLLAASLSLASARANASRTELYVERISQPNLPDEPLYPRAWRNLLITIALAIAVLWIVRSLSELVLDDQ
ncbi:hypothetical protein G4G27_01945 [Sphingomonas sp. So64.6b]|uniref:hypothetical protein n=1 Tax=Sphingomonas sp. So64.6b TaxID=2997354 RepID=UPI001601C76D|nr:hypothetical protein [Sphingomonas sp. So64.6b]QNA82908.1 hypothetical protein G4G27_01945 [Sphingomonas sp. So64.6b]